MQVEADQSGRIDQTDRATVLAMANGMQYSIRIPAPVKRECLQILRRRRSGKDPRSLYVLIFATVLYLLLKEHISQLGKVIVDTELPGHEAKIKEHALNLFRRSGIPVDPEAIIFQRIGKKSPAHKLAWRVYNGLADPDQTLGVEDILAEF